MGEREQTSGGHVSRAMVTMAGLATSRGFAAGPVFLYAGDRFASVPGDAVPDEKIPEEVARFHAARAETRRQIEDFVRRLEESGNSEDARIFSNHLLILDDFSIVRAVERHVVTERLNAACALHREFEHYRTAFGKMDDPYLKERIRDIDDVESRLLRVLAGQPESALARIDRPVVIVADDLTPSETLALKREFVLGFATDRGSVTSHVALLARSLGIPAVTGLGDLTARVRTGDLVLLDGTNGAVTMDPDDRTRAEFGRLVRRADELSRLLEEDRGHAGTLKDGSEVDLYVNAQPGISLRGCAAFGAQGIGLYRTEYLWLSRETEPTEDEQFETYRGALLEAKAAMGESARVVFRVLDLGGDKLRDGAPRESNPFLGARSIRYLLAHRAVLRTQLRAILRASAEGSCSVMFPMIADAEELREANAELRAMQAELAREGVAFDPRIPRGAMIETPAAALDAARLAPEVDFFSIGTNDLVQYTMAADRGNERVAYLYRPTHPAVIRLVAMAVDAASAAGVRVGVCGETASDPVLAAIWISLGVKGLSMNPSSVPVVKKALRGVARADLDELAARVKRLMVRGSANEIYEDARAFLAERIPDFADILSFFS